MPSNNPSCSFSDIPISNITDAVLICSFGIFSLIKNMFISVKVKTNQEKAPHLYTRPGGYPRRLNDEEKNYYLYKFRPFLRRSTEIK